MPKLGRAFTISTVSKLTVITCPIRRTIYCSSSKRLGSLVIPRRLSVLTSLAKSSSLSFASQYPCFNPKSNQQCPIHRCSTFSWTFDLPLLHQRLTKVFSTRLQQLLKCGFYCPFMRNSQLFKLLQLVVVFPNRFRGGFQIQDWHW